MTRVETFDLICPKSTGGKVIISPNFPILRMTTLDVNLSLETGISFFVSARLPLIKQSRQEIQKSK